MIIFITVGTEKFSFDRLIRIVDDVADKGLIKGKFFAQIGESNYIPKKIQYSKFLEFRIFLEHVKRSDLVITHAGVGTLLNCLSFGKIPIIFPRLHKYSEHLDDHQLEFSNALEREGAAIVARNGEELIFKIKNYNKLIKNLKVNLASSTKDKLITYLNDIVES